MMNMPPSVESPNRSHARHRGSDAFGEKLSKLMIRT